MIHSLRVLFLTFLSTLGFAQAHVVEQLFMDFQANEHEWQLEMRFDAGFALPEMRNNKDAIQPRHEWLKERSPEDLERIKDEADKYIRECLSFSWEVNESEQSALNFETTYPAWKTSPPSFDLRFTDVGYAYFSILLTGKFPENAGALILNIAEGQHPDFVIGYDLMGEDRVLTSYPGKSIEIWSLDELNSEGAAPSSSQSFYHFLDYGFRHVIPHGLDHVLFIAALCFLGLQWRPLLMQSINFTIGHSITLALAVTGMIPEPNDLTGPWIEALIAATICYVAVQNLKTEKVRYHRIITIFVFGLIHGLGFASVLSAGIRSADAIALPLLAANLGVELGQVLVITIIFASCFSFRHKPAFQYLRKAASLGIAAISSYWIAERVLLALA